jgi:hypothetical protein
MNATLRNNLVNFAESHGHRAEIRPEDNAVLVYTQWVGPEGETGFDCDRVRNMTELRQLLGYGD